jgi:hypothetical protein
VAVSTSAAVAACIDGSAQAAAVPAVEAEECRYGQAPFDSGLEA